MKEKVRITKWVAGGLEVLLGIPVLGGSIIVGLLWIPLAIMLAFHIINLVLSKNEDLPIAGSILGIIGNVLGWIPLLGMIMHILTAIFVMIEAYKTNSSSSNSENISSYNTITDDEFIEQVEQAIFKRVNKERVKARVTPLTYNTTMEKYARIKSQDMENNNYFSHADLNGDYIVTQMESDGVTYNAWGENIAYIMGGVTDPIELANKFMKNWMNSKGHRENILSKNFESIGVGIYKVGNKVYATQEFYK